MASRPEWLSASTPVSRDPLLIAPASNVLTQTVTPASCSISMVTSLNNSVSMAVHTES